MRELAIITREVYLFQGIRMMIKGKEARRCKRKEQAAVSGV